MDNFRSDGPGRGEETEPDAAGMTPAPNEVSVAGPVDTREGDVIRGLRSGLIFSIAIWAMLFAFGALVFA